jgi:hypothetical protein
MTPGIINIIPKEIIKAEKTSKEWINNNIMPATKMSRDPMKTVFVFIIQIFYLWVIYLNDIERYNVVAGINKVTYLFLK